MLAAALRLFGERGYDGTSIADLADATGLSKAAFSYHFTGKDEILVELAMPLVTALESIVDRHENLFAIDTLESLLGDALDALLDHRAVAVWVDADKSVMSHHDIGPRLDRIHTEMRRLIAGGRVGTKSDVWASSVLGAIWRPIRNLTDIDVAAHRSVILNSALELAARQPADDSRE
jgi:AcrR family transcriptional regulator